MKRITLLFTTILCASALNGMEAPNISDLPTDVHNEIINMAFATSNNLQDTIKAIHFVSTLRRVRYDNLKDFTRLVHILADKFNTSTEDVAKKFEITIAETYLDLGQKLLHANNINEATQLIQQGADVNFIAIHEDINVHGVLEIYSESPLLSAIMAENIELVTLLLDSGAKPESWDYYKQRVWWDWRDASKVKAIKQLLEQAKKKQQHI